MLAGSQSTLNFHTIHQSPQKHRHTHAEVNSSANNTSSLMDERDAILRIFLADSIFSCYSILMPLDLPRIINHSFGYFLSIEFQWQLNLPIFTLATRVYHVLA